MMLKLIPLLSLVNIRWLWRFLLQTADQFRELQICLVLGRILSGGSQRFGWPLPQARMALNQTVLIRAFYECMWMAGLNIAFKNNQVRGWYGEWLARKYLQKRSFYILQKNWQSPLDARREIDLIARDGRMLGFY